MAYGYRDVRLSPFSFLFRFCVHVISYYPHHSRVGRRRTKEWHCHHYYHHHHHHIIIDWRNNSGIGIGRGHSFALDTIAITQDWTFMPLLVFLFTNEFLHLAHCEGRKWTEHQDDGKTFHLDLRVDRNR